MTRYQVEEAGAKLSDEKVCVSWLSEEKKVAFENRVEIDMKKAPEVLLEILKKAEPNRQFAAEYEVPAV